MYHVKQHIAGIYIHDFVKKRLVVNEEMLPQGEFNFDLVIYFNGYKVPK